MKQKSHKTKTNFFIKLFIFAAIISVAVLLHSPMFKERQPLGKYKNLWPIRQR